MLLGVSDFPMGVFGSQEFSVNELSLRPGQCMLIYSDGVPEVKDVSGA
jgi:serine phosphatase RsbU (regulator of sigma subunit)